MPRRNRAVRVVLWCALGLFWLTLPRPFLGPGKPCRLSVVSKGAGSRRWFALNAYADVAAMPR